MTVSKLQIDVAKQLSKAGEVARFLDGTPRKGLNTFLLKNLWAIAHAAAHVLFKCLVRMSEALAELGAEEMPLFDTPADHAMTVREIEKWIDGFKGLIIGSYHHDDTGRGDFEPAGGLAGRIKAAVAEHLHGIAWVEVGILFEGESHETFGADIVEMLLWAMVHTGELEQGEGDLLVARDAALSLDIGAMLEAQRELGTEAGLPDDDVKVIPLGGADEAPDLVDAVSVKVFAGDGATKAELVEHFGDAAAVSSALAWLVEKKKVEAVTSGDGDGAEVRYVPFGQDLEALHGDNLRCVYERETGEKAGRKGEPRMREEIAKAREARSQEAEEGADEE